MKKVMFVGAVGTGKTTLTQRLKGAEITYAKTQAIQFYDGIIDTPGEFVQHRYMYNALTVTAAQSDVIGLIISAKETQQIFPQGFSTLFTKPVIGIITKMDLLDEGESIECLKRQLKEAGAREIFEISSTENTGVDKLIAYLE